MLLKIGTKAAPNPLKSLGICQWLQSALEQGLKSWKSHIHHYVTGLKLCFTITFFNEAVLYSMVPVVCLSPWYLNACADHKDM